MEHSFNIELAKEYGILEAILLKNIWFWIEKNRANEKNFYDGTYWTYNSTRAFNELFPYASESSIKRALKSLQEKGIIKTGNYNKSSYDRTLWYAFTDLGYSIVSNRQMETNKSSNGNEQNELTIPDINTNYKTTNIKTNKKEKKETEFDSVINENFTDEELKQTIYEFIKMRKAIKKPMTTRALELLIEKLNKMASNEKEKIAILNQSIEHCWQTIYALKEPLPKEENIAEEIYYNASDLTEEQYAMLMRGELSKGELRKILEEK